MKKILTGIILGMVSISANADNIVVTQAKNAGVKQCLSAIEKVSEFIIGDGSAGSHSIWNTDSPDKQAFSVMIERNYSDGTVVTNLNVAPVANGACYAEYEKIMYYTKSCLAVSHELKDSTYKGELNKEVGVIDHDGVNVYLMPAGNNCIAVRKETISNAQNL